MIVQFCIDLCSVYTLLVVSYSTRQIRAADFMLFLLQFFTLHLLCYFQPFDQVLLRSDIKGVYEDVGLDGLHVAPHSIASFL